MTSCGDLRVLFRAPAGPRRGFGHLVRCRSLALALGVRPLVALRGALPVEETALALGCDVVRGGATQLLKKLSPDVLVVDDPIAADARKWIRAGRRAGCLVVSLHDLGLGCHEADLVIDGSLIRNAQASRGETLSGPRFAVLDPTLVDDVRSRLQAAYPERERDPDAVLVALGGGPRAELALDIAESIVAAHPRARVRVAGGFSGPPKGGPYVSEEDPDDSDVGAAFRRPDAPHIAWVGPVRNLHAEMARASVAVVGGGVSLYEACAHGVAAVGVPVVPAQRPTVAAFVARGAARGVTRGPVSAQAVAAECAVLLSDAAMRRHVARMGARLIDGRGAFRAAAAVSRLARAGGTR
jgi:spore coat polysaccharide biosynthesis predicted glycosyltransferase SpsG